MGKAYLARAGKVWRRVGTKELLSRKLELKQGENLLMFEQVPEVKPAAKPTAASASAKKSESIDFGKPFDK